MIFKGMRMNSGSGKISYKFKTFMLANRHLAPGVDTPLLKTHFSVVTDAIGSLIFHVKSNNFTPTVNIVCSLSYFYGLILHTILS